jgi:hypothetical protein
MHIILLILGALCIVAGLVPLWLGLDYPFDERMGLMLRATIAIIGGLTLIALGSVISHLRRLREAVETLKLAPSAGASPAPAAPDLAQAAIAEPRNKPAADFSARAETVVLSRERTAAQPSAEGAFATGARESAVAEWPRVDASDRFASSGTSAASAPAETPAAAESGPAPRVDEPPTAGAEPSPPASKPTILKSGVIEGIPYTAYSDGSFEAEFTEGTQRFASFQDLRMHFASRGIG